MHGNGKSFFPVSPTPSGKCFSGSKDDAVEVPHETLKAICEAVSIPVIAIGGISAENVHELSGSGICGIAVISAIFGQKDIKPATEKLKKKTEEMVGK